MSVVVVRPEVKKVVVSRQPAPGMLLWLNDVDFGDATVGNVLTVLATGGGGPQFGFTDIATDAEVDAKIEAHRIDTTDVHGIADTSRLLDQDTVFGGVVTGTFDSLAFAVDMATQDELNILNLLVDDHIADTTDVHGISDTANLVYATDLTAHTTDPTHPYTNVAKTWTALQTFSPATNTSVGLVVQGLASQSGNLQEWLNSAGTILSRIGATGAFAGPAGSASLLPNSDTGGFLVNTNADANKGLVIRRNSATQTANLFETQNESGVATALLSAAGAFRLSNNITVGATSFQSGQGTVGVIIPSSGSLGITVKAAASQSADLQQWQDSSGAVIAAVTNTAKFAGAVFGAVAGGRSVLVSNGDNGGFVIQTQNDANKGLVIRRNSATQTANLFETQDEFGNVKSRFDLTGNLFMSNSGTVISANNGRGQFVTSDATQTPIIAKGAASQTANLQEWQDSAGNVLANIKPDGRVRSGSFGPTGSGSIIATNYDTGALVVLTAADANKGLVIRRNSATQTANLFETQTETGTALATINGAGGASFNTLNMGTGTGKVGIASGIDPNLNIAIGAAASRGITVKAAASQTANLQEWQDSTGAVQAFVNPAGRVATSMLVSVSGGKAYIQPNGDTGGILLGTNNDANKGLVIRRNSATQTANLFEIQDETGSPWTWSTSGGSFRVSRLTVNSTPAGGYGIFVLPQATFDVAAVVQGRASQTGDLQQWQNSTGGLLARVTAGGGVYGAAVRTINQKASLEEDASGGILHYIKATAQASTPPAGEMKMYVRDGTNAGTLKLVALGPGNVEKTIVDNIA